MPDIDFQRITLNCIPNGDMPSFYASQYENGRPFIADIFWGDEVFTPGEGCWAEVDIRKVDGNLIVLTDDVTIDTNVISVLLPQQAVTCIGKNLGQIKVWAPGDEDICICTLNFWLEVQPDPLAGGVTSQSDIDNLESQIAAIVPEVIGDDYYTKGQTDALLADKADASITYTKTEVDNALALKANSADLATVATTGDYDDLINKPVIPAAQIQSDYTQADTTAVDYIKNKPDIAGMIADAIFDILPVGSASGNPCTFDTEISALLQALTAEITASGGGGTPSTPIPIVGHSELNLNVNGTTFTVSFGQTVYSGVYDRSGRLTITHVLLEKTVASMNNSENYPGWQNSGARDILGTEGYYDITGNCGTKIATNFSGQDTLYLPKAYYDNMTQTDWQTNYPDLTLQMLLPLATPIVIDVSYISPSAVVGTNNITSDCGGDVNVSYKDTIQHYIDNQ